MLLSYRPQLRKSLDFERKSKQSKLDEMPIAYPDAFTKNTRFREQLTAFQFLLNTTVLQGGVDNKFRLRGDVKNLLRDHDVDTNNMFNKIFSREYLRELREQIEEDQGVNLSNFLNPDILRYEVQVHIKEQEAAAYKLATDISEAVGAIVHQMLDTFYAEFPRLSQALKQATNEFLEGQLAISEKEITKMLRIETELVYARSGMYERILKKIGKDEAEHKQENNKDELLSRVN